MTDLERVLAAMSSLDQEQLALLARFAETLAHRRSKVAASKRGGSR